MSDYDDDDYGMLNREGFRHDPLGHVEVRGGMTVGELVEQYGHADIGATDVHEAVDIYAEMLTDSDCTVFMSLTDTVVLIGMYKVASDLTRDGRVDALVTTGANLTHDAIEAIGGKHHHGRAHPDPSSSPPHSSWERGAEHHDEKAECKHDGTLRNKEVGRIYSVYLPQEHFALFESHLRNEMLPALEEEGAVSIIDLCRELGHANSEVNDREGIDEDTSIAAAAYKVDVSIYCPAVRGSALGLQTQMYSQASSFSLGVLADMTPLTDPTCDADTASCLLVGDGVPRSFALQTMLVTSDAYNYGAQITMDPAATGRLSGAMLDKARPWGKLEKGVHNTTISGDTITMLPLLAAVVHERTE